MNPIVMFILFVGPLSAVAWKTYCESLDQISKEDR